MVLFVQNYKTL